MKPGQEFSRYFLASLLALAVDVGVLLVASRFVHYLWAASLGFALGAVVSYLLATRWAFVHRRLAARPGMEFGAYALVGIVGLGVNNLAIFLVVELMGLSLMVGKGLAAGLTFAFNFAVRKLALFRK